MYNRCKPTNHVRAVHLRCDPCGYPYTFTTLAAMYSPANDPKYQAGDPPLPPEGENDLIVSPDARRPDRVPPGQARTRKWPVLDAYGTPDIQIEQWSLTISGLTREALSFDWIAFQQLPRVSVFADFHCVTRWSRLGNCWEGAAARMLLELAGVEPAARFVILHAADNSWTTNVPLADFLQEDVLLATRHDGELLSAEHGGPVRAVIPRLYAWKSAKWLTRIELSATDRPGYWESLGYHHRGDPWSAESQRFSDPTDPRSRGKR